MANADEIGLSNCNCPQFVDFTALNNSEVLEDDSFFEKASYLEEKLNSVKIKNPSRKTCISNATDSEKFKLKMHNPPRKRSMSVNEIDKIKNTNIHKANKLPSRKRSISVGHSDIKKHRYPGTPLCLKRVTKTRVIKTSEELELEKIAKLQSQLAEHLRLNKKYLKKLGLQERSVVSTRAPLVKPKPNLKSILNEKRKAPISVLVPNIKYESRINQTAKNEAISENVSSVPDGLPSNTKKMVRNKTEPIKSKINQKISDIQSKTGGILQTNGVLSKNTGASMHILVAKNIKPVISNISKPLSNNKLLSYENKKDDSQISEKPLVSKVKSYYKNSEHVLKRDKSCLLSNDKAQEKENIPMSSFRSYSDLEIIYDKNTQELLKSARGLKLTPKAPPTIPQPFHFNSFKRGKDKQNFNGSFRKRNEMLDEKNVEKGANNRYELKTVAKSFPK